MNTKSKGTLAEMEVALFFKRAGYTVSFPFGDNEPYDLVVESTTNKLYRVQVRGCSWKNDSLEISLRSVTTGKGRSLVSKCLDLSRIEVFAAWDGSKVYLVPVAGLNHTRAFTLRKFPGKSGRPSNLADEFLEATHLVP